MQRMESNVERASLGPIGGKYAGQRYYDLKAADLIRSKRCVLQDHLCVGDIVINTARNADVRILGIQEGNKYLIYFASEDNKGKMGRLTGPFF